MAEPSPIDQTIIVLLKAGSRARAVGFARQQLGLSFSEAAKYVTTVQITNSIEVPKPKLTPVKIIAGIIGGIIIAAIIINVLDDKKPVQSSSKTDTLEKAPAKPASAWEYSSNTDQMTSKVVYFASVDATKELDLDFPYQHSIASLNLRTERNGMSIFLYVTKGQLIAATAYQNGTFNVRFDNDNPTKFTVIGSSDYSRNYLFVLEKANFLNRLKSAKRVIIETEFFDNGTWQMEFNTMGLEWNH